MESSPVREGESPLHNNLRIHKADRLPPTQKHHWRSMSFLTVCSRKKIIEWWSSLVGLHSFYLRKRTATALLGGVASFEIDSVKAASFVRPMRRATSRRGAVCALCQTGGKPQLVLNSTILCIWRELLFLVGPFGEWQRMMQHYANNVAEVSKNAASILIPVRPFLDC